MRIVVALGGNALLRRGEPMSTDRQLANVVTACEHLAPVALEHELLVSHGNGPQIGLLALEEAAYELAPDSPLDVLGAQTQGMIGYLVERELANRLPPTTPVATLITMIEVDADDPALADPTKPIGPLYGAGDARDLAAARGWVFKADGDRMRRVVPSPMPRRIREIRQIRWLLEQGSVVICAGGGGIPTIAEPGRGIVGVEAVIDKDRASALLGREVGADLLVMATDVPGAFVDFSTPRPRLIARAHPDAVLVEHESEFAEGSMLPKVAAACGFARATGNDAVIGALDQIDALVAGAAGTRITNAVEGIEFAES
jgi:carbamate kinase